MDCKSSLSECTDNGKEIQSFDKVGSDAIPKISVIAPVYKVEKYLAECIESVLAQSFRDFELILVDDGSPDKSGEICDAYAKKDARIRVLHKENGGVTSARRLGVEHSRAEWITFVDSDDILLPGALAAFLRALEAFPQADLIEGVISKADKTYVAPVKDTYATGLEYAKAVAMHKMFWYPCPVSKLLRKSVFVSAQALDVPAWINYGEDLLMCLRHALKLQHCVKIPEKVYFYRNNPTGACNTIKRDCSYFLRFLQEAEKVCQGEFDAAWRELARYYFVVMFFTCDDWDLKDAYLRHTVKKLSRYAKDYSTGTRLCLFAARMPKPIFSLLRRLLRPLLGAKLKVSKS